MGDVVPIRDANGLLVGSADVFLTTDGLLFSGTVVSGGTWVGSGSAEDFNFTVRREPVSVPVYCFACFQQMVPVRVHGHEQCPFCRSVIRGCCEGDCP